MYISCIANAMVKYAILPNVVMLTTIIATYSKYAILPNTVMLTTIIATYICIYHV